MRRRTRCVVKQHRGNDGCRRERDAVERREALIMVRTARKVKENTKKDPACDMRRFRAPDPDAEIGVLALKYPSHVSFARVFAIPKSRYACVACLNPGAGVPLPFPRR